MKGSKNGLYAEIDEQARSVKEFKRMPRNPNIKAKLADQFRDSYVKHASPQRSTESLPSKSPMGRLYKPLGWLASGLGFLVRAVLIGWATLAIYFSNLPWPSLRLLLAVLFMGFGVWVLWLTHRPRMSLALRECFLVCSCGGSVSSPPIIVSGDQR
jgi:hypothetical protein